MMHFDLNEKILAELHKHANEDKIPAEILMDILYLSKESAYRRLRNEVKFTLDEASKLSLALDFSLDMMIGNSNLEKAVFDLDLFLPEDKYEDLMKKMDGYIHFFQQMRKDSDAKAMYALNGIPYTFYLSYDDLTRFKYFKWLYQASAPTSNIAYDTVLIPSMVMDRQRSFVAESRYISNSTIILDRNVFMSVKYDIEYFYNLKLIKSEDVKALKLELLDMLSEMEIIAKSEKFKSGTKVQIYISNIDLEASYSHFEYDGGQYSHLRLYGISGVETHTNSVCKKQKAWIESHKRYSHVISGSGEMQRFQYFGEQRELINSIVSADI